jgi:hypothetical protein
MSTPNRTRAVFHVSTSAGYSYRTATGPEALKTVAEQLDRYGYPAVLPNSPHLGTAAFLESLATTIDHFAPGDAPWFYGHVSIVAEECDRTVGHWGGSGCACPTPDRNCPVCRCDTGFCGGCPAEHTEKAKAVAAATGFDLDAEAESHGWSAVGIGPVGRSRDSEALELSNFDVVYADLSENFGEAVSVARFGHWGVGWIEELIWDNGRSDVVDAVEAWDRALGDYPVADDMHFSETEWSMNHPSEGECYSEDSECPCDANRVHLIGADGDSACVDFPHVGRHTEDAAELTCDDCLALTAPVYAGEGQLALSLEVA